MMIKAGSIPIFFYLIFFVVALGFSFLINSLFLKFSRSLGVKDQSDIHTLIRWGSQAKPALGGISFYITFLLSVSCYSIFIDGPRLFLNTQFIGLILSCTIAFLMGLADDSYNTRPFLKFFVQFTCGMILISSGLYIKLFTFMPYNYALTLFWVVGMMNSINMLDNMDAISTLVSLCIMITILSLIIVNQDFTNIHLMILLGLIAGLCGFLFYNWNPSKMYMGDTGSQFLGIFLAAMGIQYFWNLHYSEAVSPFKQLILPLLAFIMPIVDTSVVVIKRLLKRKSPFVGGKDHTTHALAYHGLSDSQVAITFATISLLSTIFILIIEELLIWNNRTTIIFSSYLLMVFATFFYLSVYSSKKRE